MIGYHSLTSEKDKAHYREDLAHEAEICLNRGDLERAKVLFEALAKLKPAQQATTTEDIEAEQL